MSRIALVPILVLAAGLSAPPALSQAAAHRALAGNVVVPQSRAFATAGGPAAGAAIAIEGIAARVDVAEQIAFTTLDIRLKNVSSSRQEAELLVPVPDGAVIKGFAFDGPAAEPTAELLPADEARRTYDEIVARVRDPALLEFAGFRLIRSSVFPIERGATQMVRLAYEHLLPSDGGRVDYVLPRSAALDVRTPWSLEVSIASKLRIAAVYSPSHALDTLRTTDHAVVAKTANGAPLEPGAFRLSFLLEGGGMTGTLFAYPDAARGGGYFLLLAGLPGGAPGSAAPAIRREVTLVFDRSGSMKGDKFAQVTRAAEQVIAGLAEGERFNVIAYNEAVDRFAEAPVEKNDRSARAACNFLRALAARGGTNIGDALAEALRPAPAAGVLPLVIFLTDGLPTVGLRGEEDLKNLVLRGNPHGRRIFALGVGADVNTPLLDQIAAKTRGRATFALPGDDVTAAVRDVFKRLAGPVVAGAELIAVDAQGAPEPGRLLDVTPAPLPDYFAGDQLVVLGRYAGSEPLHLRFRGNVLGAQTEMPFTFALDKATTVNAFVPRLWASRRIATLVESIRSLGAAPATAARAASAADPRFRELLDEVVALSTEFGILTEYTAFLAKEGTDLSQRDQVRAVAEANFQRRAVAVRSGLASVNQDANLGRQRAQTVLNQRNAYLDENMVEVAVDGVRQVDDLAFYQRRGRWVDARLLSAAVMPAPRATVAFGTPEYRSLLERLVESGRQACLALPGDVLLQVDGHAVLVQGPPKS